MNRIVKYVVTIVVILVVVCANQLISLAASKTELNNQKSNIDEQINETKTEITNVKNQMSSLMKEINKLDGEIDEYETKIDELETQINTLQTAIDDAQSKIEKKQKQYDEKYELLQNRLVALYEAGQTTFLDVLLTSKSLTEFISNYYLLSEVTAYDTELLETLETQRKEIEAAKTELENNKVEIEAAKTSVEATRNSLKSKKATKNNYVGQLSEEEKALQSELEQFNADKKAIEAELKKIAEEEARKNGNTYLVPSASGYINPIAGISSRNITCGYGEYSGHSGIDFGGVSGKKILAVKSGTVEISRALRNSNGSYRSYGEYIVINHHDGTMTLYAHGVSGSRQVSPGDKVEQGQYIMNVGNTGNSSGPHLHFEVKVRGVAVNPRPYLPI